MTATTQKGNYPEKDRTKLYTILGILIAVCVAAFILWDHDVFQKDKNVTAATIGEQSFDVAEVSFYYYQIYNNTYSMANMYAQYGMSGGYDTSLTPDEQYYDKEAGITYDEYFRETALKQLQQVTILNDRANADSYTLSEDGLASVESQLESINDQLLQYSVTYGGNKSYYFKQMYGEFMTKDLLKRMITEATLASEYANWRAEQFTYDAASLNAYYETHSADLDSYDYRLCYIAANPETDVDEEGNEVAPTEEQTAAAMEIARKSAEAMKTKVRRGGEFNTVAMDYVNEDTRESYSDPDYNLTIDSLGNSLTAVYGAWLKDDARRPNEVGIVEEEGSGYYVIQFLKRERRENSYQTVDVNSILIQAETSETTDEEGNVVEQATEEQLAAAYTKAEELLADWTAMEDKTSETFLALAPESPNAGEPAAEVLSEAGRNTYGAEFDKWAFTPGATSLGSTMIIDATDSTGTLVGYRIMYLSGFGQIRWEYSAESALRNADYDVWYTTLTEQYPIFQAKGMDQVGIHSNS